MQEMEVGVSVGPAGHSLVSAGQQEGQAVPGGDRKCREPQKSTVMCHRIETNCYRRGSFGCVCVERRQKSLSRAQRAHHTRQFCALAEFLHQSLVLHRVKYEKDPAGSSLSKLESMPGMSQHQSQRRQVDFSQGP